MIYSNMPRLDLKQKIIAPNYQMAASSPRIRKHILKE
jgi:hypothetical protein